VQAIANLVASSIPEMSASQVTVVDQSGRLLSSPNTDSDLGMRDKMFELAHHLEESYAQRIQELLTPLVGPGRVRAQVVAQVDMATTEQTREQYNPQSQVVRSESGRRRGGAQWRQRGRRRAGSTDQSTSAARRGIAARRISRRRAVGRDAARRRQARCRRDA
jgi:flagellar M-ring protein FliF